MMDKFYHSGFLKSNGAAEAWTVPVMEFLGIIIVVHDI